MRISPLLLLLVSLPLGCALDAEPEALSLEHSLSDKADRGGESGCFDASGFDICSHEPRDVYESMEIVTEYEDAFLSSTNFIVREGLHLGQPVTCLRHADDETYYSCKYPVPEKLDALWLFVELYAHPESSSIGNDRWVELKNDGVPTGDLRLYANRTVGAYSCQAVLDVFGTSNRVNVDDSSAVCSALIVEDTTGADTD